MSTTSTPNEFFYEPAYFPCIVQLQGPAAAAAVAVAFVVVVAFVAAEVAAEVAAVT